MKKFVIAAILLSSTSFAQSGRMIEINRDEPRVKGANEGAGARTIAENRTVRDAARGALGGAAGYGAGRLMGGGVTGAIAGGVAGALVKGGSGK
jgi:hypothetical protein